MALLLNNHSFEVINEFIQYNLLLMIKKKKQKPNIQPCQAEEKEEKD